MQNCSQLRAVTSYFSALSLQKSSVRDIKIKHANFSNSNRDLVFSVFDLWESYQDNRQADFRKRTILMGIVQ